MQTVTYQTAGGNNIKLEIVTERINAADHNFTVACYDLMLSVNGRTIGPAELVEHPEHGTCLKHMATKVLIPDEHVEAVRELVAKYTTERDRRRANRDAADERYETHRDQMRNVMGY